MDRLGRLTVNMMALTLTAVAISPSPQVVVKGRLLSCVVK